MFWSRKPTYRVDIKQGKQKRWRFYAYSDGDQTVDGVVLSDGDLISQGNPYGETSPFKVETVSRAALRGWQVVRIETIPYAPREKRNLDPVNQPA